MTSTRYWNELVERLKTLHDVQSKTLESRVSYWRTDGTRFCKVEKHGGDTTIVLTELDYDKVIPRILNSEPDQDNRIRIRIRSKSELEMAVAFAEATLKSYTGEKVQISPSGD